MDEAHLVDAVHGANQFGDVEPGVGVRHIQVINPFHKERKDVGCFKI